MIYAAATYAGALLETLVHTNIGRIPRHQINQDRADFQQIVATTPRAVLWDARLFRPVSRHRPRGKT